MSKTYWLRYRQNGQWFPVQSSDQSVIVFESFDHALTIGRLILQLPNYPSWYGATDWRIEAEGEVWYFSEDGLGIHELTGLC